jgi:hypothetical protein
MDDQIFPNNEPLSSSEPEHEIPDEQARVTDVQTRYVDMLMQKPHVIGVAVGMRKRSGFLMQPPQLCLVVMVDQKVDSESLPPEDRIPTEIEGIPVDVQEMGTFTAF